jgi:ABC-2 type transport system permease protein
MMSGAFFPIKDLPIWLKTLVYINPFTYDVEALRWFLTGSSTIPISLSFIVIVLFSIFMLATAGRMFGRMEI